MGSGRQQDGKEREGKRASLARRVSGPLNQARARRRCAPSRNAEARSCVKCLYQPPVDPRTPCAVPGLARRFDKSVVVLSAVHACFVKGRQANEHNRRRTPSKPRLIHLAKLGLIRQFHTLLRSLALLAPFCWPSLAGKWLRPWVWPCLPCPVVASLSFRRRPPLT